MINTFVWGFCGKNGHAIVKELRKVLSVQLWVSDSVDSRNIWDYLLGAPCRYRTTADSTQAFKHFYQENFLSYQIMATRRGLHYSDLHKLTNEFAMLYYHFDNLLSDCKVDLVIFSNMPHEGPDYILYQLAKTKKIKTLLCNQSIFGNRFFMTTKMGDFGQFVTIPSLFFERRIVIEEGYKQDLFYMESALKEAQAFNSPSVLKTINIFQARFIDISKFIWRQCKKIKTRERNNFYNTHKKNLCEKLRDLKRQRHYEASLVKHSVARQNLSEIISSDKKIVYFPLHLQPELTTSSLGGIYQDQIYAIEVLDELLDEEWVILVKENPKQKFYQRDDMFFKRLLNIPRVYFVDKHFPSISIIENSDLIATITGTAGWEAIKGGSKCLVFGRAWFSSLGNCLNYYDGLDIKVLNDFLVESGKFSDLHQEFDRLSTKMGYGVVDANYIKSLPDYSLEDNASEVSSSLLKVVGHESTVWV